MGRLVLWDTSEFFVQTYMGAEYLAGSSAPWYFQIYRVRGHYLLQLEHTNLIKYVHVSASFIN